LNKLLLSGRGAIAGSLYVRVKTPQFGFNMLESGTDLRIFGNADSLQKSESTAQAGSTVIRQHHQK